MTTALAGRTLRPLRHLAWRTTAAGNIALVVPGAVVAIVLGSQDGHGGLAGIIAVVALLVAAVVILPAMRIRTRLDEDGVTTYWTHRIGAETIERSAVRRSIVRTIYDNDGISTTRHLFLVGGDGRAVLRMSTRWWTDEQLLTVAHHFAVPLESQSQPVHLAEVRRTAWSQLSFGERHRISATAVAVIVGFVLCLGYAALTTAAL